MIVSINQPAYLAWPGYFHRIAMSDIHIVLDSVQFEKNSFINRNKIRIKDGWCWLTVPIRTKDRFGALQIEHLQIDGDRWREKHFKAIQLNYARAPYYAEYESILKSFYKQQWREFNEMARELTRILLDILGIKVKLLYSSELCVDGRNDQLLLNLCKHIGTTTYISGPLGSNYLRESIFKEEGVCVEYHNYKDVEYAQTYRGCESGMSVLDLIMNHGPHSMDLIRKGQEC